MRNGGNFTIAAIVQYEPKAGLCFYSASTGGGRDKQLEAMGKLAPSQTPQPDFKPGMFRPDKPDCRMIPQSRMIFGRFCQRPPGELSRHRLIADRIGKHRLNHGVPIFCGRELEASRFSKLLQHERHLLVKGRQSLFDNKPAEIEPGVGSNIGKIPFGLQCRPILLNRMSIRPNFDSEKAFCAWA